MEGIGGGRWLGLGLRGLRGWLALISLIFLFLFLSLHPNANTFL